MSKKYARCLPCLSVFCLSRIKLPRKYGGVNHVLLLWPSFHGIMGSVSAMSIVFKSPCDIQSNEIINPTTLTQTHNCVQLQTHHTHSTTPNPLSPASTKTTHYHFNGSGPPTYLPLITIPQPRENPLPTQPRTSEALQSHQKPRDHHVNTKLRRTVPTLGRSEPASHATSALSLWRRKPVKSALRAVKIPAHRHGEFTLLWADMAYTAWYLPGAALLGGG